MINLADIFVSTAMVLLIMVRAALLDRRLPWFERGVAAAARTAPAPPRRKSGRPADPAAAR